MSQNLYEQYKDALRRGHVAALRGRLDVAIAAYEAAATIAPDRALPHASLGGVFRRLGRVEAAEAAFAAALERSPTDEVALRGRAELRAELGERLEAARDFEALADALERAGRLVDACDAARRALELAESRGRRRAVERLAALLRERDADPSAAEALRLAMLLLEPMHADATEGGTPTDGSVALDGADRAAAGEAPAETVAAPEPEPPPLDPIVTLAEAEALLDAGDTAAARGLLLALAAQQRAVGHLDAALDACLVLMPIDPSDAALQLEIAANQVARGWTEMAAEKVGLMGRLAALEGDEEATAAVAAFAAAHGFSVPGPQPGTPSGEPATGA